jgi:hypothetical protein
MRGYLGVCRRKSDTGDNVDRLRFPHSSVLYDMTRLLRAKGANVVGGFLARGEVYHPGPSLVGAFPVVPTGRTWIVLATSLPH